MIKRTEKKLAWTLDLHARTKHQIEARQIRDSLPFGLYNCVLVLFQLEQEVGRQCEDEEAGNLLGLALHELG